jgi:hypothetical protein
MRRAINYILICIWLAGILLALTPAEALPDSFRPFVSARGTFDGKPVQLGIPKSRKATVSVSMAVRMNKGVCKVSYSGPDGNSPLLTLGGGAPRFELPTGSQLVLDPGTNPGSYEVYIGPKWHPLAPPGKLVIFFACLGGLISPLILRRNKPLLKRLGRKRFLFLIAIAAISCLSYSVVHEFGHLGVAVLLGGKVNKIVWTMFSGEEPHVSFSHLPDTASPWMAAGGILFPTLVGLILVGFWITFSKQMSWYMSVLLVVPGLVFLFSNVACLLGVIIRNPLRNGHMAALALHLGLQGVPKVLLTLSPLFITIIVYILAGIKLFKTKTVPKQVNPADG